MTGLSRVRSREWRGNTPRTNKQPVSVTLLLWCGVGANQSAEGQGQPWTLTARIPVQGGGGSRWEGGAATSAPRVQPAHAPIPELAALLPRAVPAALTRAQSLPEELAGQEP